MAIKVIKHGNKPKFTKICPECGCEFEYELSDTTIDSSMCLTTNPCQFSRYILCPECGHRIFHGTTTDSPFKYPDIIYTNDHKATKETYFDNDPCKNCLNKGGLKDAFGNPIAGDSPCQWCPHNPYKLTCSCSVEINDKLHEVKK